MDIFLSRCAFSMRIGNIYKQSWRINLNSTEFNEQKATIKTAALLQDYCWRVLKSVRDFWSFATSVVCPDWRSPTDFPSAYEIFWQLLQRTTALLKSNKSESKKNQLLKGFFFVFNEKKRAPLWLQIYKN